MVSDVNLADDEHWMWRALQLADQAEQKDEVPVGAVLVRDGIEIGAGYNCPIGSNDPTAHAEIVALRAAARGQANYRLPGSTLYVTIEPCTMCVGAIVHARVSRVVFGAREPKAGAVVSHDRLLEKTSLNWRVDVREGVLADTCSTRMSAFFKRKRASSPTKTVLCIDGSDDVERS